MARYKLSNAENQVYPQEMSIETITKEWRRKRRKRRRMRRRRNL